MAKNKSKSSKFSKEDIIKRCSELGFILVLKVNAPAPQEKNTNKETVFFPENSDKGIVVK